MNVIPITSPPHIGKIINSKSDSMWIADVTFPAPAVAGYISWGDIWDHPLINTERLYMIGPDGDLLWCGEIGEHHIWKMTLTIYKTNIIVDFIGDDIVYKSYDTADSSVDIGYLDFTQGSHIVYSALGYNSQCEDAPKPEEMDVFLQTPTFRLIRQGNDFWFE